ncbi:choice-of-anchor I family protein [Aliivibrio kagoshimensis]|uniref:choice-of-anchor I family protein n=1 Tax=Aliivibrio kagoshimensis TaxID=2910230 RepID=UPI003D0F71B9
MHPLAKSFIAISITSLFMTACTSQSDSTTPTFNAQCNTESKAAETNATVTGLTLVGRSIADAPFESSSAEIVSYDVCSDQLYVVNSQAKKVDIITLDDNSVPSPIGQIDLQSAAIHSGIAIGAANSVATHEGLVAVAIENEVKQQTGIIALYRSDNLELITTFTAGALPDMVSFSKNGRYIASANEGEPNSRYSIDPKGSVTLIDLHNGPLNAIVHQIGFEAFNQDGSRHDELPKSVRISGPNASVSQDLEPEYLTFADNGKLYVALQENNALAAIDVESASVDAIFGLGEKSWSMAQLDASNKDKVIGNFHSYPMLSGLYMPDSITSYSVNGQSFIVTANEGDGREYGYETTQLQCDSAGYEWDGDDYKGSSNYNSKIDFCVVYSDETRGKKLNTEKNHPLAAQLKDKKQLGRLKVIKSNTPLTAEQNVHAFGSRSFSIWDQNGEQVFDSGDQFARIAQMTEQDNFNSSNNSNDSSDSRSDDKGVEPEALEVALINGRHYAFIGLERQGGVMVYDISDPSNGLFITYVNNRNYQQPVCTKVDDGKCDNATYNPKAGDLGPESIDYFQRKGQHFIAVGNEVSGTTSVYRIDF